MLIILLYFWFTLRPTTNLWVLVFFVCIDTNEKNICGGKNLSSNFILLFIKAH
jgi:hypothetical protein